MLRNNTVGKINLKSSVFKGDESDLLPDKPPESRLIKGLVTHKDHCECVGGLRKVHTWDDPRCIYYIPKKDNPQPQQLQLAVEASPRLLPPPKENAGEMFEKQTGKSCFNFQVANKVTRDMEMIVQAYNRTVRANPVEYLSMTDNDCMSLTFAFHMIKELNAMGYIVEESPFDC